MKSLIKEKVIEFITESEERKIAKLKLDVIKALQSKILIPNKGIEKNKSIDDIIEDLESIISKYKS